MGLTLRNARTWEEGELTLRDVTVEGGVVAAVTPGGEAPRAERVTDLQGRILLPGLVNGHDHLDFSTFPPLGRPPYASVYEWTAEVDGGAGNESVRAALAVPLADRLLLGGLRNLLAGATAVAHHNSLHRSLARRDFPVRVLSKYEFAHSPGLTPRLRNTYRTTDRRIPWMVHAAEGTDERCRGELQALVAANVLRQNTVIIHGIALSPEDAPRIAAARACVVWCPESNRRLYGATAPVAALRRAGVRVGLGSDGPASGVRDPLSNLAAARAEAALGDTELVVMATRETAEVARLPVGGFAPGDPADFIALDSWDRFLAGRRDAVALVIGRGQALYGEPELMNGLAARTAPCTLEGRVRLMEAGLARRAAGILRAHPAVARTPWIAALGFP